MSVTVNDILKLPCMNGSEVIAGKGGLSRVLSSVTVLEFADANDLQQEILSDIDFYGSEMVITAFANIPDNVEYQCANIRRLAAVGEAGMILYYVGIIMPRVDQALIDLANELDFVLILMPENRRNLRYSEVITEVMEAIIKDQSEEISVMSDVLDYMCRLPEHQRTIDTVLRITRDRIRTSLILADCNGHVLSQSNWPMSLELHLNDFAGFDIMKPVPLKDNRTVWRYPLNQGNPESMELYIIKDGNTLTRELVTQIVELIRLAVSLWSNNHADVQISELIRAILRDEPLKMRRLAELFHIDISSIHSMWVLSIEGAEGAQRQRNAIEALTELRNVLAYRCNTAISDIYEGYIVGFMAWNDKDENISLLCNDLSEALAHKGISVSLFRCYGLIDTADVRHAFLMIKDHADEAKRIWPARQSYSLEELEFVSSCCETIEKGEDVLESALKPLKLLEYFGEGAELLNTLGVYLLDADSSVSRCADMLFLHKNTIKYRLGRIGACLGYNVNKEPEKFNLYKASAMKRLLEK